MNVSGAGRCLAVWSLVTLAAAALVRGVAMPELAAAARQLADPAGVPFDRWLVSGCAATTLACAVWGWLVTTVVVAGVLRGRETERGTPGVPVWAQRVVLTACGLAAVGAAVSPAAASSGDDSGGGPVVELVEGLPLPDRAESVPRPPVREVRPGDCLWEIAASELAAAGRDTDAAAITERWHRIYERNQQVVGDDPDLIHPGQRLQLPPLGKEER